MQPLRPVRDLLIAERTAYAAQQINDCRGIPIH